MSAHNPLTCDACAQLNEHAVALDNTRAALDRTFRTLDTVRDALRESVKLQSHYAGILNDYDGGKRLQFDSAEAWIARLNAPRDGKAVR